MQSWATGPWARDIHWKPSSQQTCIVERIQREHLKLVEDPCLASMNKFELFNPWWLENRQVGSSYSPRSLPKGPSQRFQKDRQPNEDLVREFLEAPGISLHDERGVGGAAPEAAGEPEVENPWWPHRHSRLGRQGGVKGRKEGQPPQKRNTHKNQSKAIVLQVGLVEGIAAVHRRSLNSIAHTALVEGNSLERASVKFCAT